jgi:iron complex outermembrane recepter protein
MLSRLDRRWAVGSWSGILACGLPLAAQDDDPGLGTPDQPYRTGTIAEPAGWLAGGGTATVWSGPVLREQAITAPRSMTAMAPNLTVFDASADRVPRFSLRGLRENNFGYGESAAVVYLDGVPYYDLFSRGVPLYNIETAEFRHGPQGTVQGASRPGGVLNLYSRQPGDVQQGWASLGYGNYNAVRGELGFEVPVVPGEVSVGLDGLYSRRDGYFHNLTLDTHPDGRETKAGRFQVRWTPEENLHLTLAAHLHDYDDGAWVARPIDGWTGEFYEVRQDTDGSNRQQSQTYSLRAAWSGEQTRVVNVLAYRVWDQNLTGDFDFSEAPSLVGFDRPELRQWSEEIRVESTDPAQRVRWSVGFFAAGQEVDRENGFTYGSVWQEPLLPPLAGFTQTTRSRTRDLELAAFGQLTWSPVERLDLTGGLRSEFVERRLDRRRLDPAQPPYLFESEMVDHYNSWQPKAGVAYRFSEAFETWLTAASGYQPGGFSAATNDPERAAFDAADSMHLELGLGGRYAEDRLRASVSLFWTATRNYQVYRPVSASPMDYEVLNADHARALGVEAEIGATPVRGLDFRLAAGLVDAKFTEFDTLDPLTGQPLDLGGNTVNFVPQFTVQSSVTYRFESGWFAGLSGKVVGPYWFDELNTRKQPAYGLLDARAGWSSAQFEIAVYGRNLLGEEYYANVFDLGPAFGWVGTPGDPTVIGVEAALRF